MVPRDYRYHCFDDCTQVSPRPRPRAKSFFFFFLIQDMRVNLYVQGTLQRARLKIPFAPVSGSKILHIVLLYYIECFSSTVKNNV